MVAGSNCGSLGNLQLAEGLEGGQPSIRPQTGG